MIERLRFAARRLVRELGMLQLDRSITLPSHGHYHALIEIERSPGITISKLGHLLAMPTSSVSRIAKDLSKLGFVHSEVGSDKREKWLYLTIEGQQEVAKIHNFSIKKVKGALEFLSPEETESIAHSMDRYAQALEQSRTVREQVSIATLSTSRTLRKQIAHMVGDIQKHEFALELPGDINDGILQAEQHFHFNHSCNFWYAINQEGVIIGCIGLVQLGPQQGEIRKFFVLPAYRGKGIAQKLMQTLFKAAVKHGFEELFLGTHEKLAAAHRFYEKCGFVRTEELPETFEKGPADTIFFRVKVQECPPFG